MTETTTRATDLTEQTTTTTTATEFDRQVQAYLDAGYPALAGLDDQAFTDLLEPLRDKASRARATSPDRIAFAVVVTSRLVTADLALPTVHWKATTGWTEYTADDLAGYRPLDGVDVPDRAAYLVTDVDTGTATLDVRAKDAVPLIVAEGRSPLTIDEGVSLLTLWPGILKDRNAFFLPGARDHGKRVAALWVSKGHPRLGWCWEGNPHTWLGSASCGSRVG
ncbi:hypothetical protein SAMN04489867_2719 [Pedococcus dokdonensis]|uniref:Uncharacterized protein n=1 Tax=Pedococcus dokdonensis TaxID=443156 RepID=A0A1H0TBC5_9MICO|nr:DUF5701 family protein [Pedococcus dokdonensis]SDP51309.1 hypothetical protein SAMN04489867_2719 [Pedococcus dokdonensis]